MTPRLVVRAAELADLDTITDIYNEAIRTSTATFDLQPRSSDQQRDWFTHHGDRYPILVACGTGTEPPDRPSKPPVIGWASLSPWSGRCGYNVAVEVSVYVDARHRGRGVGRQLCRAIVQQAGELGFHAALARITAGNAASVRLFESFGFERVGLLKEVGRKFGQLLDVHILERLLD